MKKFLVSAADVYGYTTDGTLMFTGKTLLDTSIETSLSNVDVRGGRNNMLQYIFYHSAEMKATITDAQWNLDLLAQNVGSTITTGNSVWKEELVTLGGGGAGTVTSTPLASFSTNLYGWVTLVDGVTTARVTFSGSNFTCAGAEGDIVTVRYYAADASSRSLTIRADMLPAISYLIMEAQLCSSDSSTNRIGTVQVKIPRASMVGSFSIGMKSDGVASTPLTVRALASNITANDGSIIPVYATITEILTSTNWYTNVESLAIVGGNFSMVTTGGTHTIVVKAIHSDGSVSTPPVADLTFTSGTEGTATIGENTGVVTPVGAGTSLLTAVITSKNTIEASCVVTVTTP